MTPATNILTLQMESGSQQFFDAMRQAHYPSERNQIAAHLTLFHTLPNTPDISVVLAHVCGRTAPFVMTVNGLRSLGRGGAYTLQSAELLALHGELADEFHPHLTSQDKQRFKPHVVFQNKSTPERARALLQKLERTFHALEVKAIGLQLWHYLGGPWELAETFPFTE